MKTIVASGVRFAYLEEGSGPLVLCLHGFPDTAHAWGPLLPRLAQAGYHAVAPFLRGYAPTAIPDDHDYGPGALGRDVLALIEAFGAERAHVVGHDWGAFSAYYAANTRPAAFHKMVTVAAPHGSAIRITLDALRRSWHMPFFLLPGASFWVRRDHYAFIDRLVRYWSPTWRFTAEDFAPAKEAMDAPGGLDAILGYYRQFAWSQVTPSGRRDWEVLRRKTSVPALCICGGRDGAIDVEPFERARDAFTAGYELMVVEGAGHFPHREEPDRVGTRILEFLGA
jgi:pimeloyl-ACP methyl ester carboxylesterase